MKDKNNKSVNKKNKSSNNYDSNKCNSNRYSIIKNTTNKTIHSYNRNKNKNLILNNKHISRQ